MMNCDKIKELLSAYIDDECTVQEKQEIEEHIKHCSNCMDEYNLLIELMEKTNQIEELEVPKDLHDDIMHKIHGMSPKKHKKLFKIKGGYSVVAAAIIICVIFGYLGTGMIMKLAVKNDTANSVSEDTASTDTTSSNETTMMAYDIASEINTEESTQDGVAKRYINTSDDKTLIKSAGVTSEQPEDIETYDSNENYLMGTAPDENCDDNDNATKEITANASIDNVNVTEKENDDIDVNSITIAPDEINQIGICIDEYGDSSNQGSDTDAMDDFSTIDSNEEEEQALKEKLPVSEAKTATGNADTTDNDELSTDSQEDGINGATIGVVILALMILFIPGTLLTLTRRKRPK